MGLAVVRDLRERRSPAGPEELARFETDVLAGFVLARASAGLADGTIRSDVGHLEQVRTCPFRGLVELGRRQCFDLGGVLGGQCRRVGLVVGSLIVDHLGCVRAQVA